MAKIAIFLPDLSGGGAERSYLLLANGLAARGHSVDLVLTQKSGPYLKDVSPEIRIVDLNVKVPVLSFGRLSNYLRIERPAIVFSALNQANVAAIIAARLAGVKVTVSICIQNNLSLEAMNAKGINLKVMPYFVKAFYPMADEIVAVSNGVADDLAEMIRIPRSRIKVIYNPGVTDELFELALQPIDHPWFGPGNPPVVLAVGRLNIQKNYTALIRAFAKVVAVTPARLLILGEGEERGVLEALSEELGVASNVAMPGFVDNPFAYMKQSALFVLSSLYEGLPGVMIQALATGCPIVSTDCPSGPSEILHAGKFGKLVPVGDEDALASAILATLAKPKTAPPQESWAPYLAANSARDYEKLIPTSGIAFETASP